MSGDGSSQGSGAGSGGGPSELVLPPVVQVLPDAEALAGAAAERVAAILRQAVAERGAASLALAGGSTPRPIYQRLAAAAVGLGERASAGDAAPQDDPAAVDWRRIDVYWGDERAVPPDDPASNYGMARRVLLDRVAVDPGRVHRMRGELSAEEAARLYEVELILTLGRTGAAAPAPDDPAGEEAEPSEHGADDPAYRELTEGRRRLREEGERRGLGSLHLECVRLDLCLLGLGGDGHTASLFPAAFAGHELEPGYDPHPRHLVAATQAPAEAGGAADRVSLTLSMLSAARRVVFVVSGEDKAEAVADVLRARGELDALLAADEAGKDPGGRPVPGVSAPIPPAARVRPTKLPALWLLDLAAASRLPEVAS